MPGLTPNRIAPGETFSVQLDRPGIYQYLCKHHALQGNLDPAVLFAPRPVIRERVEATLAAGRAARGHVFNLGHGVPPDADPAELAYVVDVVHQAPVPGAADV